MDNEKSSKVVPQVWSVPLCSMLGIVTSLLVGATIFLRHMQPNAISVPFANAIFGLSALVVLVGVVLLLVMYYRPRLFGLREVRTPEETGGHAGSTRDIFGGIFSTLFALGCMTYFCVAIYTQANHNNSKCFSTHMPWVWMIFGILFVVLQLFFYFDHSRQFHRLLWLLRNERSMFLVPVRIVFVVFIAANLNLWFYATQTEGIEDYCHLEKEIHKNETLPAVCQYSLQQCNLKIEFTSYLLPFTAEYSIFMLQEVLLWFRLTLHADKPHNRGERSAFFKTRIGLALGAAALCTEIASLSYAYISKSSEEPQQIHVEIIDSILHLTAIIAFCAVMTIVFRADEENFPVEDREDEFKFDEIIDLTVLQATYAGFVLYTAVDFCVNVNVAPDNVDSYLYAVSVADALSLVDASLQVFLVWILSHKKTEMLLTQSNAYLGLLVYMFFYNLTIWFASSNRNVHLNRNPHATETIDGHVWAIVTHVSIPLTIYFRFHLAETYIHLLKIKAPALLKKSDYTGGENDRNQKRHLLNEERDL